MTSFALDLDTVRALHALGETGSIGKTAMAQGISQQAISARIRAAERRLGLTLVTRSRTGSALTPTGQLVVEWGIPLLAADKAFQESVTSLRSGAGTALTVAASQTISEAFVPIWLRAARSTRPTALAVRLLSGNSDWVVEQVAAGEAHLGFVETPSAPAGVQSVIIGSDELVLVVAPDHPWASGTRITSEEVAQTPLITRELGSGTRRTIEDALARLGLQPASPAAQLSSTGAVRSAIAGGIGPGVISARLVSEELADRRLIRVATDLELRRPLRAVWAEVLSPASREMLEVIATSEG